MTDRPTDGAKGGRSAAARRKSQHDEIIEELRTMALVEIGPRDLALPPPADIRAEDIVLEAVLEGRRRPSQLACRAADFWHPLHGAAFAVAESLEEFGPPAGPLDIVQIAAVIAQQGASAERVVDALFDVRDYVPVSIFVDDLAARVHLLAERRRAIRAMQELEAAFRTHLPAAEQLAAARAVLDRLAALPDPAAPRPVLEVADAMQRLERQVEIAQGGGST